MLRLDTTTRKLQIVLAGAVTTAQLPVTVSYSDSTTTAYVGGTQLANTNNTTAVDICAAPAASTVRDIDTINVQNADTALATVIIRYNDNGTNYTLFKSALVVGDQLTYVHGQGWKVLDSAGNIKTVAGVINASSVVNTPAGNVAATTVQGAINELDTEKAPLASPSFTGTLTHSGDVVLSGSGKRITGDFSSATVANRVMFQTSTVNGATGVYALANGTATSSQIGAIASSDPAAGVLFDLAPLSTEARLRALGIGVAHVPMTFYTGGAERMRVDTSGNVGIGGYPTSAEKLAVINNRAVTEYSQVWHTYNGAAFENSATLAFDGTTIHFGNYSNNPLGFITNNTERMRIDTSGNVKIGTGAATASSKLMVNNLNATATGVQLFQDGTASWVVGMAASSSILGFSESSDIKARLDVLGNFSLVKATGALGYGTGAGGTVTQATSKSTAVTLNKPTGQITMNNAALAAGASVSFQVANSLVSVYDIPVVVSVGYASYKAEVIFTSTGNFTIRVTNISAGSLSEAVVIQFAIIKGAAS